MNISCAPKGIVEFGHPKQGIGDVAEAGFEQMLLDLTVLCPPGELEGIGKQPQKAVRNGITASICECPDKMHEYVMPILENCKVRQLHYSTAVAPYLNRNTKRDDLNHLLGNLAMESVEACCRAGCRYLIVRPLFAGVPVSELWECNMAYYLALVERAKKYDICILLENQCRDMNGHMVRGACSEAGQAAEWIDLLNETAGESRFGFCLNVGVCNLCGQNMYDFILKLGNRLKAVILCDCDGNSEGALLPFTSVRQGQPRTDWLNLIRGLREIGFDGELIVNLADTAAVFSPILRPGLLRLAKSVADYFKWQIEIEKLLRKYPSRVLFGAGNMCRNYMKCYGEKYPPLFTCDNNRNIWETDFCGLMVRPPEALKDLPEECAVFICNIYYREIEAQLRQMGIKNPIAFFNDEYMPSFYFDRVDRQNNQKL